MSSLIRRMQRQVCPSRPHVEGDIKDVVNPPRGVFFMGRGSRLGVSNAKDKSLIARLNRGKARAARLARQHSAG